MTAADVVGWVAVCVGMGVALPQLVRLARTHKVDGLSLTSWRSILSMNIAWAAHGIRLEAPALIITNSIGLCSTLPILYLLSRQFSRRLVPLLVPSLVVAAAMIAVDNTLGSAAYGVVAIAMALVSNLGQSMQLVRAPHVTGVSPLFVTMAVLNQSVWIAWGLLAKDPGTIMTASTVCGLASFNLLWYALRRGGLRAFLPHDTLMPPPALANVAP
ncbi:MAG: SemiSWEET family sugar transporter [Propionibacteriaceae bacterium]